LTRRLDRGFASYEAWRDEVLAQEERDAHKLDRKIAMELDWVRYGVTARRKRNQRRMAELGDLRRTRREQRQAAGSVRFSVADADYAGTRVSEAKAISKSYDGVPVVRDFSIRILRGDRLGIVGPNGAGKTTLLNLLTGRLKPDSGEIKLGTNLQMATLDQNRALLDPEMTLSAVLTGGVGDSVEVGGRSRHVMSYMKDFLFLPEQARTPVRVLSGGERARLLLAKALATPSNLLVLDEPTNDLDLETLDLLEEMIADYPGTALIVSHDRDFLDRVATSVLMAEGNGKFVEYAGGYSDMVAQRGSGIAASERAKPQPVRTSASNESRNNDAPRRKLGFAEKHALDTLPATIAMLTKEIAALHARLSDGALYARDPDGFVKLSSRLNAAQAELSAAEERWLELEMRREDIERSR
jgi:ATP-binding cassette subfamily F protein uup